MSGYKPKNLMELVGIGGQTYRYWKGQLDPNPERPHFSAHDVLCYRIIKTLVRRKCVKPALLKEFDMLTLFNFCYQHSCTDLKHKTLVLDCANLEFLLYAENKSIDRYNYDLIDLPLKPLVLEHLSVLENYGAHLDDNVIKIASLRKVDKSKIA